MKYRLIEQSSLKGFNAECNKLAEEGWEPCTDVGKDGMYYYQQWVYDPDVTIDITFTPENANHN